MVKIPLEQIEPGNNDRKHFESVKVKTHIQLLAESIAEHGLDTPIKVQIIPRVESVQYRIIAGECRYRAHKLLGLAEIEADIVEGVDSETASIKMWSENYHRLQLDAIDEAEAIHKRMTEFGWSKAQCAKRMCLTPSLINARLPLLDLIKQAQDLVRSGTLPLKYAERLADLKPELQQVALKAFANGELSGSQFSALMTELYSQQNVTTPMFDLQALESAPAEHIQAIVMKDKWEKATTTLYSPGVTHSKGMVAKIEVSVLYKIGKKPKELTPEQAATLIGWLYGESDA